MWRSDSIDAVVFLQMELPQNLNAFLADLDREEDELVRSWMGFSEGEQQCFDRGVTA